nr:hypothetical protein [Pandoravirus massiliensis]
MSPSLFSPFVDHSKGSVDTQREKTCYAPLCVAFFSSSLATQTTLKMALAPSAANKIQTSQNLCELASAWSKGTRNTRVLPFPPRQTGCRTHDTMPFFFSSVCFFLE